MITPSNETDAIWAAVDACNRAWIEGSPESTKSFYTADAVLVPPDRTAEITGREAIAKSYERYVKHATTDRFEVSARTVDVFGDGAVATYRYEISYTVNGKQVAENGQEVLALRKCDGDWKAVWRTQVPGQPRRAS